MTSSAREPRSAHPIEVDGFRMEFGRTTVIEDLSFHVNAGETFGLLGSNGSGKTTTIRALLGIYPPTAGRLLIDGAPFSHQAANRLGYLPEERGLYRKEPVLAVMTYFGQLKGLTKQAAREQSGRLLERVGLSGKASTRLDRLSGGQQQKVQLAVTLLNSPSLLILDEPTKGFDPVNRRLLMDLVEEQRAAGATVVIITHQMEEVERLCDRILLLKDGRSRACGTIAQVQDQFGGRRIRLRFSGQLPSSVTFMPTLEETNYAELAVADGVSPSSVLAELISAGVEIRSYEWSRTSLEEIFLRVYGSDEGVQGVAA